MNRPAATAAAIFTAGTLTGALALTPQPADARHNETIPHGAIIMFEASCPKGWVSHRSLNAGRFPRGGNNATGGATGHQHRVQAQTITSEFATTYGQYQGDRYVHGYPSDPYQTSVHDHQVRIPEGLTTWQQHLPPHHGVTFCRQRQ